MNSSKLHATALRTTCSDDVTRPALNERARLTGPPLAWCADLGNPVSVVRGSAVGVRGRPAVAPFPAARSSRVSAVPFKLNQDRRHCIPRQRHKVTHWQAYEAGAASRRRRPLTSVWFSDDATAPASLTAARSLLIAKLDRTSGRNRGACRDGSCSSSAAPRPVRNHLATAHPGRAPGHMLSRRGAFPAFPRRATRSCHAAPAGAVAGQEYGSSLATRRLQAPRTPRMSVFLVGSAGPVGVTAAVRRPSACRDRG